MARRFNRFRSNRSRTSFRRSPVGWVGVALLESEITFDQATIARVQLVDNDDMVDVPAGQQFINLKRIVGDLNYGIASGELALNDADDFYGIVYWALFLVDKSDSDTFDPSSSTTLQTEICLGMGSDRIHLSSPTGNPSSRGTGVAALTRHIDFKTNRRLAKDDELILNFTAVNLTGASRANAFSANLDLRILITTGIRGSA